MPPRYPRVSGSELASALQKLGFVAVRQKGSHAMLKRGSVACIAPMHRELKTGTLAGILKQAGVSLDDLREYL